MSQEQQFKSQKKKKKKISLWKFSQALYYLLFYKCLQHLHSTLALVYQQYFTEIIVLKSSEQILTAFHYLMTSLSLPFWLRPRR